MKKNHGKAQDNALKAVLRTPLFRQRVVKAKKGKGSYNRKGRGESWLSSYKQAA